MNFVKREVLFFTSERGLMEPTLVACGDGMRYTREPPGSGPEKQPKAAAGRHDGGGCFVTDVKPMETPMRHLGSTQSQEANGCGRQ